MSEPRYRVVMGIEVGGAETPDEAYDRAYQLIGFLQEQAAKGHPRLKDLTPIIGLRQHTEVYGVGGMP